MRANYLTIAVALLAAAATPAAAAKTHDAAAAMQPFSVQDLVRLDRISELAISPDGKRIAYTLRTADVESNKARTGIWVLETRRRNAAPVRLTDLAANSNSAAWSADGRFIYYLSNRSGSVQLWRVGLNGDPLQITNLPLDVGSFRVAPKGDRAVVSLEVYLDCADLACTKQRLDGARNSSRWLSTRRASPTALR
jgi:dipeptidyl aminopeptidase/acylaminoacyl peptidase